MATAKTPKRRSSKSTQLSRHTRAALETATQLLESITAYPSFSGIKDDPEAGPHLSQLTQDLAILQTAPKLRIGAARRLQGVSSRRQTASQTLFDACAEVRRRVKVRYRGPRHTELRRVFGEGLAASPAKPETVLAFAEQVLRAAVDHDAELRQVRVGPPTLQRLAHLRDGLRDLRPERTELRVARRLVSDNLVAVADRVNEACVALITIAGRLYSPEEVKLLPLPPRLRRPERSRSEPSEGPQH